MTKRDEIIRQLKTELQALESRLESKNSLILALREQLNAHEAKSVDERRTQIFRRAAIDIVPDEQHKEFSDTAPINIKDVSDAFIALSGRLDHKFAETRALIEITQRVNSGMFFDEVLDHVFESFDELIPYDRIGVALLEQNEAGQTLVREQWCRANYDQMSLRKGYGAVLDETSLQDVADSREPRIINNLEIHVENDPEASSAKLIVKEGVRSNLTCPLISHDRVIGFIFFSSLQPYIYMFHHIDIFLQIAGELALTIEKSRAYEDLYLRNEFIRKVFGQYVTNEVAEEVLNNEGPLSLGGEHRTVTVLMADLRGFTPMSENMSPEEVVDSLNVFLGTMTEIIMRRGGSVDNIIGDAIMAVFGVPASKPDDAARAVACAIEMQNAMEQVNANVMARHLPQLKMGIGLSSGEVVAGNIGSEMRAKYSVIGRTVNLAARIEGLTSSGQIFASDATYQDVKDIVQTVGMLNMQLKGVSQTVPVHEITGIDGDYDLRLSQSKD
ncbi:adenylate/guanylate cyclase domain-containing protein [Pseudomonadota bacterium]